MNYGFLAGGRPTRFAPKKAPVSREEYLREEKENEQEIRTLGAAAAGLLENPALETVIEQLFVEAQGLFANSALGPAGDATRSEARYRCDALASIHERLNSMVEDVKILDRQQAGNSDN